MFKHTFAFLPAVANPPQSSSGFASATPPAPRSIGSADGIGSGSGMNSGSSLPFLPFYRHHATISKYVRLMGGLGSNIPSFSHSRSLSMRASKSAIVPHCHRNAQRCCDDLPQSSSGSASAAGAAAPAAAASSSARFCSSS